MIEIFAHELARGSGFPYVLIKGKLLTPSSKLDQIMLNNIFNNLAYDAQSEGSRHDYLYDLICEYQNKTTIFESVISHFQSMTETSSGEYQVFGFVARMVKDNICPLSIIITKFEKYWEYIDSAFSIGITEIIDLEKDDGIKRIAKLFGKRISLGLSIDESDTPFYEIYKDDFGLNIEHIQKILRSDPDPMIALYMKYITEYPEPVEGINRFDFDKSFQDILSGKRVPVRRVANKASEEQYARYCNEFITIDNKKIKHHMVKAFEYRKYTGNFDDLVSEYNQTRDTNYRISLLESMIPFDNPQVRKFVDRLIDDKYRMIETKIRLTQNNENDYSWILESLEIFSAFEIHQELNFFLENEKVRKVFFYNEILDILLRKMECSICRNKIVDKMIELECLDINQAKILLYDCESDTRSVALKYIEKIHLTTAST
jgi:hypothetical protein